MVQQPSQFLTRRRAPRFPRLGALARGVALGAAVLGAACADATGPGSGANASRLVLSVSDAGVASGDSLAQQALGLTVALRDSAAIRGLRVYVDSASRPAPDQDIDYTDPYGNGSKSTPGAASRAVVVFPPTPGRHVITVAVTDTGGRVASASLTRTFAVPSAAYALTPLPDLGGDARGAFVHADGDVAGWAATPAGRKRPAVWHAGRLTVIPVTDTVEVVAKRVNGAGDVLLQYSACCSGDPWARVWRSDGTLVRLGPAHYAASPRDTNFNHCCSIAGDLNDQRAATATGSSGAHGMTALYDVTTGALVDTVLNTYAFLNAAGQLAGAISVGDLYYSTVIVTRGFTLPAMPAGPGAAKSCYSSSGHSPVFDVPVDLDDAANVLVAHECTAYAYLSPAGSVWLDRYVGRSAGIHLSRQGGIVASLDSAGRVTVWTAGTKRVVRVQAALGAVTLDGLDGVNAAGQVLVHGVDAATKKGGAYLLTPAAR